MKYTVPIAFLFVFGFLAAQPKTAASPDGIVQKQVTSFNGRDLDAFASCFSENVVVRNFPNDTLYVGNKTLKANYGRFYDNTPSAKVEVVQRIIIGNTVIDKEHATVSGRSHWQTAIYEVDDSQITSMTFIHETRARPEVEAVVQGQLDAYNARDIDAFVKTYSDGVEVHNFPNGLRFQGLERMRQNYGDFFKNTPDLHCEIKNRIIIDNMVIDEEYLTMNGDNFSAVAIYEVENGKIAKVTFVR